MLEGHGFTSKEEIDETLKSLAPTLGPSYRHLMQLCRLAVTGVKVNNMDSN